MFLGHQSWKDSLPRSQGHTDFVNMLIFGGKKKKETLKECFPDLLDALCSDKVYNCAENHASPQQRLRVIWEAVVGLKPSVCLLKEHNLRKKKWFERNSNQLGLYLGSETGSWNMRLFFFLTWYSIQFWLKKNFFFWLYPMACRILVPWPGIEPTPPAVEAWSLNHWIAREVLHYFLKPWTCT